MRLSDLLKGLNIVSISGDLNKEINKIGFDSREMTEGDVFIAIRGTLSDGHDYIDSVADKGVVSVVCEELPENLSDKITYIKVDDSSLATAALAANYYRNPSQEIKIVGVTGTNGKTTIATLLYKAFRALGYKVGLLSTVSNFVGTKEISSTHTTPDSIQLNKLLRMMVDAGCEYCFMEVSSHSVVQNRISYLDFDGGVFTNLTHEHLDYHNTFSEYIKAKKAFFDNLKPESFAITNKDDRNGEVVLQNTKASKYTYSVRAFADYKSRIVERHFTGMLLEMDNEEVWTYLVGDYNASNLLAVYSTARLLGVNKGDILRVISILKPVNGRMESILSKEGKMGIIDYAHTPDALKNVLESLNELKEGEQQIITVVGAGGDRDSSKRPKMAKVACELSNKVILTSDNPRSEDPNKIIKEMKAGLSSLDVPKTLCISDRREAIRTAVMLAQKGDIILVAGKGHETYQEIRGIKHHFDDKEILTEIFNN